LVFTKLFTNKGFFVEISGQGYLVIAQFPGISTREIVQFSGYYNLRVTISGYHNPHIFLGFFSVPGFSGIVTWKLCTFWVSKSKKRAISWYHNPEVAQLPGYDT